MVRNAQPDCGHIGGQQAERLLRDGEVLPGLEGQYRRPRTSFGEPVMSSVREIPVVCRLDCTESRLRELRLEIHSSGVCRRAMKDDERLARPEGLASAVDLSAHIGVIWIAQEARDVSGERELYACCTCESP